MTVVCETWPAFVPAEILWFSEVSKNGRVCITRNFLEWIVPNLIRADGSTSFLDVDEAEEERVPRGHQILQLSRLPDAPLIPVGDDAGEDVLDSDLEWVFDELLRFLGGFLSFYVSPENGDSSPCLEPRDLDGYWPHEDDEPGAAPTDLEIHSRTPLLAWLPRELSSFNMLHLTL